MCKIVQKNQESNTEKLSLEKTNKLGKEENFKKETPIINLREIHDYTAYIKLVLSSMENASSNKMKYLKIKYMTTTLKKKSKI